MHKVFKLSIYLSLALFLISCSTASLQLTPKNTNPACSEDNKNTIVYKIDSYSKKSSTVFIRKYVDGKPTTLELMKLTDQTEIIGFNSPEEYTKNEVVIFETEVINGKKIATTFKKNNAEIEAGIGNISVQELHKLMQSDQEMVLIDSRPAGAYAHDHLPGAISIPVKVLKAKGAELLPLNKDIPLIFYCGGYS